NKVLDEHGQNVTPHILYNPDPGVLQPKQGKIFPAHDTSWTTMTDFPSVAFQTTNASFTGPFTRCVCSIQMLVKEQVREDVMDRVVDCYLTETETIWLLDIPTVSLSVDSEDAEAARERNNVYTELCKNRQGNDKYVEP
ncbi:hypothetical protein cypCar_00002299, partial [Cyprinus carpio]